MAWIKLSDRFVNLGTVEEVRITSRERMNGGTAPCMEVRTIGGAFEIRNSADMEKLDAALMDLCADTEEAGGLDDGRVADNLGSPTLRASLAPAWTPGRGVSPIGDPDCGNEVLRG